MSAGFPLQSTKYRRSIDRRYRSDCLADELEIEMSVEELEEILALTPSIPIPPPLR
jgi:hypothetical protein